jgi:hypothetical protein
MAPPRIGFLLAAGLSLLLGAASLGSPAEYLGGTLATLAPGASGRLLVHDAHSFQFESRAVTVRIPYERITTIEYGQRVDRRLLEAIVISPLFLLSKKKAHFLSVGYETEDGVAQAMVFRVNKDGVRPLLVSLEVRTGRKVTYQDVDARKGGKG